MRFGPNISLVISLAGLSIALTALPAHAQNHLAQNHLAQNHLAQSYPRAETDNLQSAPIDLRHRPRGSRDIPSVPKGLYAERVATGLGDISALVSDAEGKLYSLERSQGRLYQITDRAMDGRMDSQRVLAYGFARPTGMALKDAYLYIADQDAIWKVDIDTGEKTHFVSLTNITAEPIRPIIIYKNRLLLGLTLADASAQAGNVSQVLSVDLDSGLATLLAEMTGGPITGLSYGSGQLWASVGQSLRPVTAKSHPDFAKVYPLEHGASALAVLLPGDDGSYPKDWPLALRNHILTIQGPTQTASVTSVSHASVKSSGGNNIVAIPTQFGAPGPELSILVGGFSSRGGRAAWAAPSAMVMDPRGLFFADRLGGSLWKLSLDNRPPPKPRARITPPLPELPKQKPSRKPNEMPVMKGSMIGEASGMGSASRLSVGSILKKKFDDKKAAEEAAKKAKIDAKQQKARKKRSD